MLSMPLVWAMQMLIVALDGFLATDVNSSSFDACHRCADVTFSSFDVCCSLVASWALMPMQLQMSALLATMLDDTAPIAFGLLHLDVVVRGMLLDICPG